MTLSLTMLFPRRRVADELPTLPRRPRSAAQRRRPLLGSIDPAVAPFPIGLAQFAPEDFPCDIARDRVDEIDRLRRLEMRDTRSRPGNDVGRVGRRPGFQ